jgi:hypothetical protein
MFVAMVEVVVVVVVVWGLLSVYPLLVVCMISSGA